MTRVACWHSDAMNHSIGGEGRRRNPVKTEVEEKPDSLTLTLLDLYFATFMNLIIIWDKIDDWSASVTASAAASCLRPFLAPNRFCERPAVAEAHSDREDTSSSASRLLSDIFWHWLCHQKVLFYHECYYCLFKITWKCQMLSKYFTWWAEEES